MKNIVLSIKNWNADEILARDENPKKKIIEGTKYLIS